MVTFNRSLHARTPSFAEEELPGSGARFAPDRSAAGGQGRQKPICGSKDMEEPVHPQVLPWAVLNLGFCFCAGDGAVLQRARVLERFWNSADLWRRSNKSIRHDQGIFASDSLDFRI